MDFTLMFWVFVICYVQPTTKLNLGKIRCCMWQAATCKLLRYVTFVHHFPP